MTKIKRWRLILAATLAAFFAVTLCFALQIGRSARAAEDGVLDGNTAEYTIVNDSAHPWVYVRGTNTWYNNADHSYGLAKVLTINVTSSGSIAFKYKANLYTSNKQGGPQYAHNQNDFYLELTKGGITNTIVALHGVKMAEYEQITIDGLDQGDKIVFKHKLAASSSSEDDRVYIQGLKKPAGDSVTVTAGVSGSGKIACDEATETSVSKTVVAGSPVVLTAKPESGNVFAYWTDAEGAILSYNDTLNLSPLATTSYTAHFVAEDLGAFTSHDGWETTDTGYKLASASVAKKVSTLTYEFVGEKYFNFEVAHNLEASGNNANSFTTYLNGSENAIVGGELPSFSQSDNFDGFDSANPQFGSGYIHVTGDGYHRLEFVYGMYKPYGEDPYFLTTTQDYFEIKNFEVSDTAKATTTITLDYEKEYGTVYIDGVATEPGKVTVPKDVKVMFTASVNSDVQSKIDHSQHVAVRWDGFFAHADSVISYANVTFEERYGAGIMWPDPSNCGLTFTDDGATGNDGFQMTEHYINAKMREFAAAPQVSLSAQIDGDMGEEETLTNGQVYPVPCGSNVDIAVLMKDFENITATYHVKINDEVQETPIVEDASRKMFSLKGVTADTKVTVYYSTEGYYDSAEFTFTIAVVSDATVENDLLIEGTTDITVANDEFVPWQFNAGLTDENGTAFIASNSGLLGYYGKAVSSLQFTVNGVGRLEFDFKLYGASYWLLYSVGRPISTSDSVLSLYSKGFKDSRGETIWNIQGNGFSDDSYKYIIARGSTDAKEISNQNNFYWFDNGEGVDYRGGKTTSMLDDDSGWAHVAIPVGEASTSQDIYVCYYRYSDGYTNSRPFYAAEQCDYAAIRNVGFFKGETTVNYSVEGNGSISVTSGGQEVNDKEQIPTGSRITFTATETEGNQFYGWVSGDGKLLATTSEYITAVTEATYTIKAVFGTTGQYFVRKDGIFYDDLQTAFGEAQKGDRLIVLKDFTVNETVELPAGVSLVLPVNDRGEDYELGTNSNSATRVPWSSSQLIEQYKNFTLTVAEGKTLTIKGSLFVGAVEHHPEQYAQGATSGKYNVLDIQGNVVVDEGGHLDVRGLVTGKGGITVKQGGKLTQPFMILDYNGGTNTQASFEAGVTPFKMYAMVNIQCEKGYTVEYGGELWGHASLFFWGGTTTIDTPFITWEDARGDSEHALLVLKEGAKVTSVYDNGHKRITGVANVEDVGKTTMTVEGGAKAGYMQFPLGINTSGVYFSLPYNYELILTKAEGGEDCTYDLENSFKLMPGSIVRVEKGATLNVVSGKGLHVYDSFSIPNVARRTYPTGAQLKGADYLPYASLIVNGTLNLQDGATFLGTVQTTDTAGKAKIVIGKDVKLSDDTLFDGVATQYTCNYTKYSLVAHVWDKVHEELRPLVAEHTYISTYADGDTFSIPGIKFQMESNTGKHVGAPHTLTDTVTDPADGLKGAWMVEHEHTYDWTTPKEDEKSESIFKGGNSAEIERGCLELGCDEIEKKVLLKSLNTFNSKTYRGTEFTGAELFEELYSGRRAEDVGATFTVKDDRLAKDVGTYTFTVALEKGYFLTADGTFEASHDFTFVIDRKNVTVSVQDQSSTYTGKEPDVKQGSYTISGLCGDDVLGIVIEKEPGTAAGEYRLTAKANSGANANGNYNIKFSYTASGHSTYTINKATLTVKPNNVSSPAGEEPITDFTSTISGFVNGERGTLEAEIAEQLVYTCTVTKDSPSGRQYAITVKFTGELQNYEVKCESGSYTVTESLFKDVKFQDLVVTYDGTEHSLSVTGTEGLTGVKVEYAPANSYKNAGTYTVTATVTARDSAGKTYTQTFEATLTIERRTVTVELLAQTRVYDGTPASAQSRAGTDWKLADGSALGAGDELSALGVALTVTAPTKNVGTYAISAVASVNDQQNGNYTVNFSNNNGNLYTITKRDLHITVTEKTTVYGESIDLDQTAWTYDNDTDFIAGDLIHVTLSSDVKKDAGNYHITASADAAMDDNKNYTFLFTDADWTVSPKEITVVITPVSVTYSGQEPAAPTLWELKAGSELVTGDEKSALNIRLAKAAGVNAGSYDINAAYDNGNYTVTFEGGKGGYTVNKYDIGGAGDFFLMAGDEASTSGTFTLRFAGQTIELVGYVIFGEIVDLKVVLSQSSITEIGEYDVTASVDDINYSGSRTFRVIVVNGNGYTKKLVDTLAQLAALTDGMTAATLTAEDFGALKQAAALIAGLDESERETGKDALAPYESLIAAWNDAAADLDAKIETAESIQNALLGGIFGAAATLGLLLAAAYVVGKGGIL